MTITLWSVQANGKRLREDGLRFALTPMRISHNLERPERIYICDVPENHPARYDLSMALRGKLPIVTVPKDASGGDTWLQDQIEFGYLDAPGPRMRVAIHLPRVRHDTGQVSKTLTPNLGKFVDEHFPSRDFGLFQDFREVRTPVMHGGPTLGLKDGYSVFVRMSEVIDTHWFLVRLIEAVRTGIDVKTSLKKLSVYVNWQDALKVIPALLNLARKALAQDTTAGSNEARSYTASEVRRRNGKRLLEAGRRVGRVLKRRKSPNGYFAYSKNHISMRLPSGASVAVPAFEAGNLFQALSRIYDSINYGGNIELLPPHKQAKKGGIVIGSGAPKRSGRFVSDMLTDFFADQNTQPVTTIDTTWLGVAHVDEVVTPVPDPKRRTFALLNASPGLAMDIVQAAMDRYVKGLPATNHQRIEAYKRDSEYRIKPNYSRPTRAGMFPVTSLLRGKFWIHVEEKDAPEALLPPHIYREFAEFDTGHIRPDKPPLVHSSIGRFYIPGPSRKTRVYFADISVLELNFLDGAGKRLVLRGKPLNLKSLDQGQVGPELRRAIETRFIRKPVKNQPQPPKEVLGKTPRVTVLAKGRKWYIDGPWTRFRVYQEKQVMAVTAKDSINQWIEHHHIANAVRELRRACPNVRILPLPVVFDTVPNLRAWEGYTDGQNTGAFTPNLVNLQVVERRLIMPRPFGPRVPPAHAIDLIGGLLKRYGMARARRLLTRDFIRRKGLEEVKLHFHKRDDITSPYQPTVDTANDLAKIFRDGFPGKTEEDVKNSIAERNDGAFDGYDLKPGWHYLTIPERTVDLFELWAEVAAAYLALRIDWLDSWYYHVRSGEIHCGTKILRSLSR